METPFRLMGAKANRLAVKGPVKRLQRYRPDHLCPESWSGPDVAAPAVAVDSWAIPSFARVGREIARCDRRPGAAQIRSAALQRPLSDGLRHRITVGRETTITGQGAGNLVRLRRPDLA